MPDEPAGGEQMNYTLIELSLTVVIVLCLHVLSVMCHVLSVMCHVLSVMCHVLNVMCHGVSAMTVCQLQLCNIYNASTTTMHQLQHRVMVYQLQHCISYSTYYYNHLYLDSRSTRMYILKKLKVRNSS